MSVVTANIHGTPFRRFSIGGTEEPRQGVMQEGQAPRGLSDPADTPGNGPVKNKYELVLLGQGLGHPEDTAMLQTYYFNVSYVPYAQSSVGIFLNCYEDIKSIWQSG